MPCRREHAAAQARQVDQRLSCFSVDEPRYGAAESWLIA